MKPKNLSLFSVLFAGGLVLGLFQKCAKVGVEDISGAPALGKSVVLATDDQGNILPVEVSGPEQVIPPNEEIIPAVPGHHEPQAPPPVASEPEPAPEPENHIAVEVPAENDMTSACGLDTKTIHNSVDLAQFEGQEVSLDLLQGKTLLYSSNPEVSLKSLAINAAVGRTILCGCKVDRLDIKKGRLEVYHSEIKSIGMRNGVLIKDDVSILPAGI